MIYTDKQQNITLSSAGYTFYNGVPEVENKSYNYFVLYVNDKDAGIPVKITKSGGFTFTYILKAGPNVMPVLNGVILKTPTEIDVLSVRTDLLPPVLNSCCSGSEHP